MRLPLEMWSRPWSCLEKQATEPDILQFAFNKLHASVAPLLQPSFEVWSYRRQWGYRSFLLTEPRFCSGIHVLTLSPRGRPNQHKENFIFFCLVCAGVVICPNFSPRNMMGNLSTSRENVNLPRESCRKREFPTSSADCHVWVYCPESLWPPCCQQKEEASINIDREERW